MRGISGVSIHALLAECDKKGIKTMKNQIIVSIHALLAECDEAGRHMVRTYDVSIHALLAECDMSSR